MLPMPAKKLKGRMKPEVRPTPKNAKVKVLSRAPSTGSSNESEDARWVEQAVRVAFPSMKDGGDEQPPSVLAHRRRTSKGASPEKPGH